MWKSWLHTELIGVQLVFLMSATQVMEFFFSRMRRRTAHQYIKKNEKGGKEPPKTKLLQDWEGL